MHNITFDLSTSHLHGNAFYQFLNLRKRFFVDALNWDIPHDQLVEMDQYDNPTAHYSLVMKQGKVIGGARTASTAARWGQASYMLGDARDGMIDGIPKDLLQQDVRSPDIWECTRLVVDDAQCQGTDRKACLEMIVGGLVDVASRHGARHLISLSPLTLVRALRQLGYAAHRISDPYRNDDGRQYAILSMPAQPTVKVDQRQAA